MHLSLERRVQRLADVQDIRRPAIDFAPFARCEQRYMSRSDGWRYQSIKFHQPVFTRGPAGRGKVRVASLIPIEA